MTEERFSCPACAKQGLAIGMWHGDQFIAETISMPVGHTSIDYDRFTCPKGTGVSTYAVTLKSRTQTKTTHMTEEEFRSKLDVLGIRYQAAISQANAVQDANLKLGWKRRALDVVEEIEALENEYRAPANSSSSEQQLWRQRRVDEVRGGTHPYILKFIDEQLASLENPTRPDEPDEPPNPLIEYWDQLAAEYYDFDKEWVLIEEIFPELESLKQEHQRRVEIAREHAAAARRAALAGTLTLGTSIASLVGVVPEVWPIGVSMIIAALVLLPLLRSR